MKNPRRPSALASIDDIKRIDTNARDEHGMTPLHFAARFNNNPEIVHALINAGADVNGNHNSYTPLNNAIESVADLFSDLINRDNNNTPLYSAMPGNPNIEVISVLINAGADVNTQSANDNTPLHWAAEWSGFFDLAIYSGIVSALISAGANINAQSHDGNTPLHLAAELSNFFAYVSALLRVGANIHAKNKDEDTPLHMAAASAYFDLELMEELLHAGSDSKTKNKNGKTAYDLI